MHLQPHQGAMYFPELVSTFGAQAFAAHWSSDHFSAEKSERSEGDSAHIMGARPDGVSTPTVSKTGTFNQKQGYAL